MSRARIGASLAAELRRRAGDAAPRECCGFLVGARGEGICTEITRIIPSPNRSPRSAERYEIDPAVHFGLQRRLRGTGEAILGVYHSHPGSPPVPSASDLRGAVGGEDWLWLIIGRSALGEFEVKAYRYDFDRPEGPATGWQDVPLSIMDEE